MKNTRKISTGRKRQMFLLPVFLVAVMALIMSFAAPNGWADNGGEIPFDVADVYAELNDTDGDLGFHALIDGEAYKYLQIEDPRERNILNLLVRGRLRRQGLTELFFESAEPPFDELAPEQFFRRFREGMYEIEAITLEGDELESTDLFRHVMPAQPGLQDDGSVQIEVGGEADTVIKGKCDDESPLYGPVEVSGDTVLIDWDPVETSHPTIGDPGDIEVALYEVFVEVETDAGFESVLSVKLPPEVTEWTVPEEFIDLGDEFKYEILVKEEEGGNQTAIESCFIVE
jgi:hypothetical protein